MAAATLALTACAVIPPPQARHDTADRIAQGAGWQSSRLNAQPFVLQVWQPRPAPGQDTLTVYLEGDGLAWADAETPSSDPTPLDPLALRLAVKQSGAVAYLARPCQYTQAIQAPACVKRYWTTHRFAPEVVQAMQEALDRLKQQWETPRLHLVGYSGGGTLALLLAARRNDVTQVVTIAGNLDPDAWTRWHRVTPLYGSLNPVNDVAALSHIPQWHWSGSKDTVVPPALSQAFAEHFDAVHRPTLRVWPGFDHRCCWVDAWHPDDPASLAAPTSNPVRTAPQ